MMLTNNFDRIESPGETTFVSSYNQCLTGVVDISSKVLKRRTN